MVIEEVIFVRAWVDPEITRPFLLLAIEVLTIKHYNHLKLG